MKLIAHGQLMRLYAGFYYSMGLNVSCISNQLNQYNEKENNLLKCPNHSWEQLIKKRQTINEIQSYDWSEATGVGLITGDYREDKWKIGAIDIDGKDGDYSEMLLKQLLPEILDILKLPMNYEWLVISGSGKGYHIIFKWNEFGDGNGVHVSIPYKVVHLLPNFKNYNCFKQIELRFQAHLVLPPSLHSSHKFYEFKNTTIPIQQPAVVTSQSIEKLVTSLCSKTFYRFAVDSNGQYENLIHEDTILKSIRENKQVGSVSFKGPYFFILDVETNGLPSDYKAPVSNSSNWPRVIEIGWILFDSEENIILKKNVFVDCKEYEIDEEVVNLTNRRIRIDKGSVDTIVNTLKDLEKWIQCVDYIIGHNIDYDIKCLLAEYHRYKISSSIQSKSELCIMKKSVYFCKIDGFKGYKYPKLGELYWKLFNRQPAEVHGADLDVMTTAECFWKLKKNGVLKIDL